METVRSGLARSSFFYEAEAPCTAGASPEPLDVPGQLRQLLGSYGDGVPSSDPLGRDGVAVNSGLCR